MRTTPEEIPHEIGLRRDQVLHICLLRSHPPGEGHEKPQEAGRLEVLQLLPVQEVIIAAATEEEHVVPRPAAGPVLQEAAHRRDACSRADHDDRRRRVSRKTKRGARVLHEDSGG
eukprot:CAMPEP_0115447642 /NCGR_PEP_ID=MMETSP0271-20121206/40074_1 /TAXON_ID=71861 /ORGANISM="Scrippsiella trochoidea, Strain CCMP3099" /LENGTH=114 /DNA_ID=CAMNT_0002873725 /DNA_START=45 /DNA_END=389 /DNA_ORIENTATION=+